MAIDIIITVTLRAMVTTAIFTNELEKLPASLWRNRLAMSDSNDIVTYSAVVSSC